MIILTGGNFYIDDKFVNSVLTLTIFLIINLVFLIVAEIITYKTGKWIVKIIAEIFVIVLVIVFVCMLISQMNKIVGVY